MKMKKLFFAVIMAAVVFASCSSDDDSTVDTEKPIIDLTLQDASPLNGDTIYFGETFMVKVRFSDNMELGSYSIDIHNNFDHHSHSTEVSEVSFDPIKTPVNPYVLIQDYTIPSGCQTYETAVEITVPTGDANGLYDEGDYHFMIQLTDKEGWSTNKGLSIKLLHR